MKNIVVLDVLTLIGLVFCNLMMFSGRLRFGREMGDLGYFALLFFGTIVILLSYGLKYSEVWMRHSQLITVFALFLLLFIAYQTSIGRGWGFPWNGIFFS